MSEERREKKRRFGEPGVFRSERTHTPHQTHRRGSNHVLMEGIHALRDDRKFVVPKFLLQPPQLTHHPAKCTKHRCMTHAHACSRYVRAGDAVCSLARVCLHEPGSFEHHVTGVQGIHAWDVRMLREGPWHQFTQVHKARAHCVRHTQPPKTQQMSSYRRTFRAKSLFRSSRCPTLQWNAAHSHSAHFACRFSSLVPLPPRSPVPLHSFPHAHKNAPRISRQSVKKKEPQSRLPTCV